MMTMLDPVPESLYRRHLGLPLNAELDDELTERVQSTREWFSQHANPFLVTRELGISRIVYAVIHLDDKTQLNSAFLAKGFAHAGVDRLVIVGITAGEKVDERIDALWRNDHPDEAMFLNAFAIASVEHWRSCAGRELQNRFGGDGLTVLPHYSPGYDGWGLADQARLFRQLATDDVPIQLLESGGLTPHKSTLAVYGVSPRTDLATPIEDYWKCRASPSRVITQPKNYAFAERTLQKWVRQRVNLKMNADNRILATFRFDGSTCSNLGVPLQFDYTVHLTSENGAYLITATDCQPRENHSGYKSMCAFLDNAERFCSQLAEHRPLVGQYLGEALSWDASVSPAGCLCSRASQDHKWRIVLQTIHYALTHHE